MKPLKTYAIAILITMLTCAVNAEARRIEAGEFTTNDTNSTPLFNSVTFQQPFDVTPIVTAILTSNGTDPADLRIRNVTTTGFEIIVTEPPGVDGPHSAENIHYIAIEPGITTLPGGTVIAAGRHETTSTLAGSRTTGTNIFDTVSFGTTLSAPASVIANIQTLNNEANAIPATVSEPFLSAGVGLASSSNVQLSLERAETSDFGSVTQNETIGWIAFPSGTTGSLIDINGNVINWDARVTANNIRGFGNGCFTNTFSASAFPNARIVATKAGRNGNNGGWLRRCALTNTTIGLQVDEDTALDNERNHIDEQASLLTFSSSFHAILEGKLTGQKQVEMVNTADYALPGNAVRYRLTAQNIGNGAIDNGTVIFTDSLPPELALRVADIDGPGSGPVRFIDGSTASGLSYNFTSLASSTDDVDFSNNNAVSFNYTPTPDSSGVDSTITHIRITPSGSFLGAPNAPPNFALEFEAVIE